MRCFFMCNPCFTSFLLIQVPLLFTIFPVNSSTFTICGPSIANPGLNTSEEGKAIRNTCCVNEYNTSRQVDTVDIIWNDYVSTFLG